MPPYRVSKQESSSCPASSSTGTRICMLNLASHLPTKIFVKVCSSPPPIQLLAYFSSACVLLTVYGSNESWQQSDGSRSSHSEEQLLLCKKQAAVLGTVRLRALEDSKGSPEQCISASDAPRVLSEARNEEQLGKGPPGSMHSESRRVCRIAALDQHSKRSCRIVMWCDAMLTGGTGSCGGYSPCTCTQSTGAEGTTERCTSTFSSRQGRRRLRASACTWTHTTRAPRIR